MCYVPDNSAHIVRIELGAAVVVGSIIFACAPNPVSAPPPLLRVSPPPAQPRVYSSSPDATAHGLFYNAGTAKGFKCTAESECAGSVRVKYVLIIMMAATTLRRRSE